MADIALVTAKIGVVDPEDAEIFEGILNETVTPGASLYLASTGKYGLADANAAGKEQFRGVALKGGAAGEAISILKRGRIAGFTISGLAYDAIVYQGDTAGVFADAASATKTIRCGRVVPLTDLGALTKVLFIDADFLNNW